MMPELHQVGVGLFILFSTISLLLVVAKPVAKEFEITILEWIRAFKRIQAEWHKPLSIESPSGQRRLLKRTHSKRK